jgi:CRISPR-associated protein Csm4
VSPAAPSEDPKVSDSRKKEKRRGFVTRKGFIEIRGRVSEESLRPHLASVMDGSTSLAHNTIDRRTGSTPETGGLYFVEEDWSFSPPTLDRNSLLAESIVEAGPAREVYVEAPSGAAADIKRLFSELGAVGYGRDANLGRGRWIVEDVDKDAELAAGPNGRLLSLSNGSAEPDMEDLRCRVVAHYGKAGPGVAVADGVSPFKKPLLLTQPGSTFRGVAGRRYGALIRGVHPDRPEIVHNAFHVVIPFAEAGP